jgi:hypothetical protein
MTNEDYSLLECCIFAYDWLVKAISCKENINKIDKIILISCKRSVEGVIRRLKEN